MPFDSPNLIIYMRKLRQALDATMTPGVRKGRRRKKEPKKGLKWLQDT